MKKIIVSACLAGKNCKYNGGNNYIEPIAELVRHGKAVTVCPEALAKLPVPRPPAEIQGGNGNDVLQGKAQVLNINGQDMTRDFCRGAEATLAIARNLQPDLIILKERSPSCGSRFIYDGTFNSRIKTGPGVTTALLRKHGFKVISEEEFMQNND